MVQPTPDLPENPGTEEPAYSPWSHKKEWGQILRTKWATTWLRLITTPAKSSCLFLEVKPF